MDPKTAMDDLYHALREARWDDAELAAGHLLDWIRVGGFVPRNWSLFRAWLRGWIDSEPKFPAGGTILTDRLIALAPTTPWTAGDPLRKKSDPTLKADYHAAQCQGTLFHSTTGDAR